jgi:hypothetical protein
VPFSHSNLRAKAIPESIEIKLYSKKIFITHHFRSNPEFENKFILYTKKSQNITFQTNFSSSESHVF